MRLILLSCLLLFGTASFAKEATIDFKKVHSEANQQMWDVLQDNPQVYETKPNHHINRGPASVRPIRKNSEKLDEIEPQADTHTSW